jgi:Zn-dependent protease
MILRNLDLLTGNPLGFILITLATILALLIAITVHEFSHAFAAYRMGDPTSRFLGRLSLNPLRHLDPVGTIMLLLVGFGWGKPVPVNPLAFGRDALRRMALVAFAGPLSNIIVAALIGLAFKGELVAWPYAAEARLIGSPTEVFFAQFLVIILFYNLILAIFNLIPLAPLDGSKVVLGILPREMALEYAKLERWGPSILFGIIILDWFMGVGILGRIIWPAVNGLSGLFAGHSVF